MTGGAQCQRCFGKAVCNDSDAQIKYSQLHRPALAPAASRLSAAWRASTATAKNTSEACVGGAAATRQHAPSHSSARGTAGAPASSPAVPIGLTRSNELHPPAVCTVKCSESGANPTPPHRSLTPTSRSTLLAGPVLGPVERVDLVSSNLGPLPLRLCTAQHAGVVE